MLHAMRATKRNDVDAWVTEIGETIESSQRGIQQRCDDKVVSIVFDC
jgi:hypothetical protein